MEMPWQWQWGQNYSFYPPDTTKLLHLSGKIGMFRAVMIARMLVAHRYIFMLLYLYPNLLTLATSSGGFSKCRLLKCTALDKTNNRLTGFLAMHSYNILTLWTIQGHWFRGMYQIKNNFTFFLLPQGLRILFADGCRLVFRRSGSGGGAGTGAIIRIYAESFERDPERHSRETQVC
jgi:hypothetical protein